MMALASVAAVPTQGRFAQIDVPTWGWVALLGSITALLIADLLIVHRKPHAISLREAAVESSVWVALGLGFTGLVALWFGGQAAGEYITGYLIEKSLSVDNVFVWAMLFTYFAVPREYQFRVLFWGIFGALVMRGLFIFAGVAVLARFEWVLFVFGGFLVFTAVRMARHKGTEVHPEQNPVLRFVKRIVPSTHEYDGQKMFTRRSGRLLATPLFVILVLVEATDVVFAVDSVPAILAISREPFIVYSSNAFAILGLRAMYFLLAGMAGRFRYLHLGLAAILAFVGVKMLVAELYHPPVWLSLGFIATALTISITASLRADKRAVELALKEGPGETPEG
ncbi:MAG TPA: TerC family protein, partial [Actinomycetota bacterium]|nr:TerC family protein [Actinomycetota bacterium]